jgi:hypothetical protein
MSQKPVFNQAEPICMESKHSLIGQLDFNEDTPDLVDHRLKINFLNSLVKVKSLELEPDLMQPSSHLIPMIYKRLLNVTKSTYDDYSNVCLTISDYEGNELSKNCENAECKINACATHGNYVIISLVDKKSGRHLLKLYNSCLELITTVVIEFKCEEFYTNDSFIYAKLNGNYPYVIKFDFDLVKQELFEHLESNTNELFVSFVVDKLVYFSCLTNRIYFNDKCFSRLKIYSEESGQLLNSIYVNNLRECSVRIDASLMNSAKEQFICLNKSEKCLRCYDFKDRENNACLVTENTLSDVVRNISSFYLTKDGYYVFVDQLNDAIYFY